MRAADRSPPLWRSYALSLAGWYGFGVLLHWHEHTYWMADEPLWPGIAIAPAIEYGPYGLLWPPLLHITARLPALAPRWRTAWMIVLPVLVATLVIAARFLLRQLDTTPREGRPGRPEAMFAQMLDSIARAWVFQTFLTAGIVGIAYALAQQRFSAAKTAQAAALREELLRAQLGLLRARLQPHFLFNALHAVGVVAQRDPREAERMLALLGDLLRSSLAPRDTDLVSLRREVELLQPYLKLQHIRFGDRLQLRVDVAGATLAAAVPDLLLQPLVENALRHGIEQRAGPATIELHAERSGDRLRIRIRDDGRGVAANAVEGVGLGTTRERLRALFGDTATLELTARPTGGAEVRIDLPWREVADG
jgi:two-component system, LytTR family, sensor kinase